MIADENITYMNHIDFYLLAAGIAYVYSATRDLRNEIATLKQQITALQSKSKAN